MYVHTCGTSPTLCGEVLHEWGEGLYDNRNNSYIGDWREGPCFETFLPCSPHPGH